MANGSRLSQIVCVSAPHTTTNKHQVLKSQLPLSIISLSLTQLALESWKMFSFRSPLHHRSTSSQVEGNFPSLKSFFLSLSHIRCQSSAYDNNSKCIITKSEHVSLRSTLTRRHWRMFWLELELSSWRETFFFLLLFLFTRSFGFVGGETSQWLSRRATCESYKIVNQIYAIVSCGLGVTFGWRSGREVKVKGFFLCCLI